MDSEDLKGLLQHKNNWGDEGYIADLQSDIEKAYVLWKSLMFQPLKSPESLVSLVPLLTQRSHDR
jgi:hypothetical protein